MNLFHGSNKKFDKFKISKELTITNENNLMEGYGVYMTSNYILAKNHGEYVYTIDINTNEISDFTDKEYIMKLLRIINKEIDCDIEDFINISDFIDYVLVGNISVTTLYLEIFAMLDNNAAFWDEYEDRITDDDDCISKQIKNSFLKNTCDIFKYYDTGYKQDIYICFRNEEKLNIVSIENSDI